VELLAWWDTCEPDVVIEDDHTIVVVEVKLFADFGEDTGEGLQLRREWRDGERRARAQSKDLFLIAVTNQSTPPESALRRQLAQADAPERQVSWLGWQDIARLIAGLHARPDVRGWADDLIAIFDRMALRPFQGFEKAVAYARSIPPAELSWLSYRLNGATPPLRDGFRAAVLLSDEPMPTWSLLGGGDLVPSGFSRALKEVLAWIEKGGTTWKLTAN